MLAVRWVVSFADPVPRRGACGNWVAVGHVGTIGHHLHGLLAADGEDAVGAVNSVVPAARGEMVEDHLELGRAEDEGSGREVVLDVDLLGMAILGGAGERDGTWPDGGSGSGRTSRTRTPRPARTGR
ncbi:hypothetical protein GCM10018785_34770 [Streptomyces longispororuber]|uniref:Uncharacterized protein n=1 Tax=Streptomyces longispororuber TaxID=68230 RepID=A0A918ZNP8_9ACTN|nr:hypothetical protein GCM10018785_34770 [Streptomyces longispororuber]